jgi:DNA topoisomerase-1
MVAPSKTTRTSDRKARRSSQQTDRLGPCGPPAGTDPEAKLDPIASARSAGLRYVSDDKPGIRRLRSGRGFRYVDLEGKPVRDEETLRRIRSLVIPPAWTEVWICANPQGHIHAAGRDERGRKQYRYHPRWRATRDEAKYDRMIAFGQALGTIREKAEEHLALPGLPREKVLATVVRLLESTAIRVGNEEYARHNGSFGLTTMRDRHVRVDGPTLRFQFRGKSGIRHAIDLQDRRLAKVVRSSQELPGQELFQYVDDEGQRHAIDSGDVNDYLREITGREFTAKDFRTWLGTVLAAMAFQEFEAFDSEAQAKKNIVCAIESVAERLGNTPTVCRECYVHPAVLETYLDGTMIKALRRRAEEEMENALPHLRPEEAAVLALLQRRLAREQGE